MSTLGTRPLAWLVAALASIPILSAATPAAPEPGEGRRTDSRIEALRDQARKVNGFSARLSVKTAGMTQSGTLLFLEPENVHIEMKIGGIGKEIIVSDGRTLWTITPDARLATKIDLKTVQRSWHRPLPNQATAIRDIFETMKPGSARFVREETVLGLKTSLFEAEPETGLASGEGGALPDHVRAWVGSDGLLRRQVLMKGGEVRMDASFSITDKNPHIHPGMFTFSPPSDYQVQDLTESTLKSLRSLEAGKSERS
jgi:outer membrane lipoprotein-sorting protein